MSISSVTNTLNSSASSATSPSSDSEGDPIEANLRKSKLTTNNDVIERMNINLNILSHPRDSLKNIPENKESNKLANKSVNNNLSSAEVSAIKGVVHKSQQLEDRSSNVNKSSNPQVTNQTKWGCSSNIIKTDPTQMAETNDKPASTTTIKQPKLELISDVKSSDQPSQVISFKSKPHEPSQTSNNLDRCIDPVGTKQPEIKPSPNSPNTIVTSDNTSSQLFISSIITTTHQAKLHTNPIDGQIDPQSKPSIVCTTVPISQIVATSCASTTAAPIVPTATTSIPTTKSSSTEVIRKHVNLKSAKGPISGSMVTDGALQTTVNSPGNVATARLIDMGKRLLEATKSGHVEHVRQLVVESGAPFTSDWLGTTALHIAAQNGSVEIAEILLRGGVNRDARTKMDRTALHMAAQSGSLGVVDLLLNHGCEIDVRDMLKMTPMHWAVERRHVDVVQRLLFAGADITVKSKFLLTPIDIARNNQLAEIVELFRNWTNGDSVAKSIEDTLNETFKDIQTNSSESHNQLLDVDYHLAALIDGDVINNFNNSNTNSNNNNGNNDQDTDPMFDLDEPSIDLVELEWSGEFDSDLFMSNYDQDEPKVEFLMKMVEELQKENHQLRQKVESLSTTDQ